MPNLDKTGPRGQGPLTGRGRGRCRSSRIEKSETGNENVENNEIVYGLGRGGRPYGGGAGNCFGGGFGQGAGRKYGSGRGRGFGNR